MPKYSKPKISTEDIYAEVNQRIIDGLAKGTAPWQKPWAGGPQGAPRNLQSGKAYRGVNCLLLGFAGYSDPRWTTFAAARKQGASVRKGERSTLVTLWKRIKVQDANAPDGTKTIGILRYFRCFNVEQVEFPADRPLKPLKTEAVPEGWDANEEAEGVLETFLDADDAPTWLTGGDRACYNPARHCITLPEREVFYSAPGFYGTAFHEAAHATGHKTMLGRDEFGGGFGSDPYAREELVAEIASALVCATIGVDGEFENSVAYLKGWASKITNDPKLFVQAAGKAQKAADRILGTEFEYTEPPSKVDPSEIIEPTEPVVAYG